MKTLKILFFLAVSAGALFLLVSPANVNECRTDAECAMTPNCREDPACDGGPA